MHEHVISEVLAMDPSINPVTISGWVRAFRSNRFIQMNDGSTLNNLQCVVDFESFD